MCAAQNDGHGAADNRRREKPTTQPLASRIAGPGSIFQIADPSHCRPSRLAQIPSSDGVMPSASIVKRYESDPVGSMHYAALWSIANLAMPFTPHRGASRQWNPEAKPLYMRKSPSKGMALLRMTWSVDVVLVIDSHCLTSPNTHPADVSFHTPNQAHSLFNVLLWSIRKIPKY